METLTFNPSPFAEIHFSDESKNPAKYSDYYASITFESSDESWGEFLSREDIERLHSWCARRLENG